MKKFLYIIIGIVLLYVILAFAGPKSVKIERQVMINQPSSLVKEKLGDFKFFHEKWNPWTAKDPNMKVEYSGTPGEVGHHYAWEGNDEVGSGAMTIKGYNGDTLLQDFSFKGEGNSKTYYILDDKGEATNVTWGMAFDVGFFHRPPMLFMNMDKMLGDEYDKGLTALKNELENNQPKVKQYAIEEMQWPEVTYAGKKETVLFTEMNAFFGKNFSALMADLGKNKINPESGPCGLFTSYDEKNAKADVIAGVKVPNGTKLKGWEMFTYKPSKVLYVAYYGSYERQL
jgi:hypothetical protein